MENIAFIDILTTMNDLHGSHNSPFMFTCEVACMDDTSSCDPPRLNVQRTIAVKMVPEEKILGNGYSYHGYSNDTIESVSKTDDGWISEKDGLKRIYGILDVLNRNKVFVVGHGICKFTMTILNEHFQRVLGESPIEFDDNFVIDTEILAKLLVDVRKCGNYSLNSLTACLDSRTSYGTTTMQNRVSDIKSLLLKLMDTLGVSSMEEVSGFIHSEHDIDVFQWGKYKGMRIEDVFNSDRQYFSWILKNRNFYSEDKDLLRKAEQMMNSEDA